jgi:hypothetical protein
MIGTIIEAIFRVLVVVNIIAYTLLFVFLLITQWPVP